jgi:urease accessory protein
MDSLLSVLHFADTAFPTGGYAHSLGLESYCQAGLVADRAGLRAFLEAHLEGAAGPCDATAMVAALRATAAAELARCAELDATLEAMKPVRELREASRQMGRQTLRVAAALTGDGRLARALDAVNRGEAPGHHAVAFGMVGGVAGWEPGAAARAFLYTGASLRVGAALRLLRMGQLEGQQVLWALQPRIARLADEAAARDAGDLWSFTPGIDVQGMRHATLEMRLFRS